MSIKDKIAEAKTVDMFDDISWLQKRWIFFKAKIVAKWLCIKYWFLHRRKEKKYEHLS